MKEKILSSRAKFLRVNCGVNSRNYSSLTNNDKIYKTVARVAMVDCKTFKYYAV